MDIQAFKSKKARGEKISMLTCYDASFARLLDKTSVDVLLVGDSVAMVQHGYSTTLPATIELMTMHTEMVARACTSKFIVADMPFLSFRKSLDSGIESVRKLMAAGAHAIKVEGVYGHEDFISHIVNSGVPVMGHLGLTPQSVHQLGGFKIQGRSQDARKAIIDASLKLESLGAFAIVLECVPSALAKEITEILKIPTIGIGAGPDTDGQVLVLNDMLGLNTAFKPKFLREFLDGANLVTQAVNQFHNSVTTKNFPSLKESYE